MKPQNVDTRADSQTRQPAPFPREMSRDKQNKTNTKAWLQSHKMREREKSSFKSNENVHKKEDGSYCVVSINKASSVTL